MGGGGSKVISKQAFTIEDVEKYESSYKCSNCSRLLNVSPIYSVADGEKRIIENVCGRCKQYISKVDKPKIRQYAYESIAPFVYFPCANSKTGCGKVLNWEEVTSHEKECLYQVICCPLSKDTLFFNVKKACDWKQNLLLLDRHIEKDHADLLINQDKFEWTDRKTNHMFLTKIDNEIITVLIKYDKEKYFLCLLLNDIGKHIEQFYYRMQFFDEDKTNSYTLNKNVIKPYTSMFEIIIDNKESLEVDARKIREMIPRNPIYYRFEIVKKSHEEIQLLTNDNDSTLKKTAELFDKESEDLYNEFINPKVDNKIAAPINIAVNEEILDELHCQVCEEFMTSPIFNCNLGHSICNNCRSKLKNCPNCKGNFSDSRNYSLERLSEKIKSPLPKKKKLPKKSLPFLNPSLTNSLPSSSSSLTSSNEKILKKSKKNISCILDCDWSGLKQDLHQHVLNQHKKAYLLSDKCRFAYFGEKKNCFVFHVDGIYFRLFVLNEAKDFLFLVQQLNIDEQNKQRFGFWLEIYYRVHSKVALTIHDKCKGFTDDLTEQMKSARYVNKEMLKHYFGQNLTFQIRMLFDKL